MITTLIVLGIATHETVDGLLAKGKLTAEEAAALHVLIG